MLAFSRSSKVRLAGLTLGILCGLATAGSAPAAEAIVAKGIDQLELRDHRGGRHDFSSYDQDQLIVVVFLGTECPLARMYAPRLVELKQEFSARPVTWVGVVSNTQDSDEEISRFVEDCGVDFPVLIDRDCAAANCLGAQRTPEAFVLDGQRTIRYRGRIDDQFAVGLKRPQVGRRDLAEALHELLAHKPVTQPQTAAAGCIIGRPKQPAADAAITFTKHVAPILNARCVSCHRAGEIAPFSVTSYDEVVGWADTIVETVDAGRMPPWFASPEHGQFINDARLTEAEKRTLRTWAKNGCPPGDPQDAPEPPVFSEGWNIPKPDVVVPMSKEPYHVAATGVIPYEHFVADPGFTEDKWVVATEVRPGNRSVVHHVLVFLLKPGDTSTMRILSGELIGAFAPGSPARAARPGLALKIPAGSKILFQMHYTVNGQETTDLSTLGLKFCDASEVRQEITSGWAVNFNLAIPPGASDYPVKSRYRFKEDRLLYQLTPHMHLRGKSFRYEAIYPDGRKETLLDVPKFDFNWQIDYLLAEPKLMPKGTVLHCTATFDNSSNNPSNPDPTQRVVFGEQTWDEMMIGWFSTTSLPSEKTAAVSVE